ncbi:hypothetical protein Pelo_955 [Pelomyxa schiedti]|nr:hypothetical protein Pelo_955 [Pelomyxa schiedti]
MRCWRGGVVAVSIVVTLAVVLIVLLHAVVRPRLLLPEPGRYDVASSSSTSSAQSAVVGNETNLAIGAGARNSNYSNSSYDECAGARQHNYLYHELNREARWELLAKETSNSSLAVKRRVYPELNGTLCIASITCGRHEMLERVLVAIIRHMELDEFGLRYQVVWTDNSGDYSRAAKLTSKLQFEKVSSFVEFQGQGYAQNMAYYTLCRWSEYVLVVDDDRLWDEIFTYPVLSYAVEVMRHDKTVSQVNLQLTENEERKTPAQVLITPGGVLYRHVEGSSAPGALLHWSRSFHSGLWEETNFSRSDEYYRTLPGKGDGFSGAELLFNDSTTPMKPFVHLISNQPACSVSKLQHIHNPLNPMHADPTSFDAHKPMCTGKFQHVRIPLIPMNAIGILFSLIIVIGALIVVLLKNLFC